MTLDDVRALLRAQMAEFIGTNVSGPRGNGLRAWCEHHDVASGHVSEFLNGKRNPSTELLDALGLQWEIGWKPNVEAQQF